MAFVAELGIGEAHPVAGFYVTHNGKRIILPTWTGTTGECPCYDLVVIQRR